MTTRTAAADTAAVAADMRRRAAGTGVQFSMVQQTCQIGMAINKCTAPRRFRRAVATTRESVATTRPEALAGSPFLASIAACAGAARSSGAACDGAARFLLEHLLLATALLRPLLLLHVLVLRALLAHLAGAVPTPLRAVAEVATTLPEPLTAVATPATCHGLRSH